MSPQEIKKVRLDLGLTQEQFAKALGLSGKNAVSNIETGFRNPSQTIVRMLRLLEELPKKTANDLVAKLSKQAEKDWSPNEQL